MQFKMTVFFLLLCLFSQTLEAQILKGNYELKNSKISYLVIYLIKKADGESIGAKGKGECKEQKCDFLVAAPIKSFKSKDNNRDLNMLTTTKADKYPLVVAKILTPNEIQRGELKSDLEIEFSGVKHLYKNVLFKAIVQDGVLHVEGNLDILLSDYKIEKPSLMGVTINDKVALKIVADWKPI